MKVQLNVEYRTQANKDSPYFQKEELQKQLDQFRSVIESQEIGFFRISDNSETLDTARKLYEKHKTKKQFVQIGIGGSALGPQMLIDALKTSRDVDFFFMDNTDSEYLHDVLNRLNPKETLFYVVSKSGSTAETIACFAIAQNFLLQNGVAPDQLKEHFVLCTDPHKGHLYELALNEGYDRLEVASNVGGRFSVLTHVGLFPALFAGINISELFLGANSVKEQLLAKDTQNNILLQSAAHIMELYSQSPAVTQTVLMPYSSKLKTLSHWFVQLWGESLGKIDENGNAVGLTPIPAYGATDQHSQMQLFMQGPSDKLIMLLQVKERSSDFALKSPLSMEPAKKLEDYHLNQLIDAQLHGTLKALDDQKKHVFHLIVERNDGAHLGALILYFESLTALVGQQLKVNPFDQPGVELGKKYAYDYLKSLN